MEQHLEIYYYDCCELGGISKDAFAILGYSIGGCIAWKACLSGLKVQHLFAVSSTRLRYETEKPFVKIELLYGKKDRFKPDNNWFQK